MKEKIQIGVPCGRNSEQYVKFLCSSIEKTLSGNFDHEFVFGVNQSGVDKHFLSQIKNAKIVERIDGKDSSIGHGLCLDLILENMNSKYGMFVDSDVAFLLPNWDLKLTNIIDGGVTMIGTEYHPTDGKIVNFPNVITCMYDTSVLQALDIRFKPSLKRVTVSDRTSPWYGVPEGTSIFLDTGCDIVEPMGMANAKWRTFKLISPRYKDSTGHLKFMLADMRGEEYQLDGVPICTHIGRSLTRSFETDPIVNRWKTRVEEWLGGKV